MIIAEVDREARQFGIGAILISENLLEFGFSLPIALDLLSFLNRLLVLAHEVEYDDHAGPEIGELLPQELETMMRTRSEAPTLPIDDQDKGIYATAGHYVLNDFLFRGYV